MDLTLLGALDTGMIIQYLFVLVMLVAMEGLLSAEFILGLAPEHISCYLLQLEEGTRYAARYREEELDEESQRAVYLAVCDRLEAAGYRQYEISNFARPGYESRHNLIYWNCEDYLGLGPATSPWLGGGLLGLLGWQGGLVGSGLSRSGSGDHIVRHISTSHGFTRTKAHSPATRDGNGIVPACSSTLLAK